MAKVCIIPARGGSKRIPRKNIKDFLGRPIISYSIQTALKSGLFDEVMVSTDDPEIASLSVTLGAAVPFFRSAQNSNDYATTVDVIVEVLESYRNLGKEFDFGCCIYPTAPLVSEQRIKEGFSKLAEGGVETVFPVIRFGYPIWRALQVRDNGEVCMIWPENLNTRSQDLPVAFHDAGQWYWFRIRKLIESRKLLGGHSSIIEIGELEGQDIDNEIDWRLAEIKYKLIYPTL